MMTLATAAALHFSLFLCFFSFVVCTTCPSQWSARKLSPGEHVQNSFVLRDFDIEIIHLNDSKCAFYQKFVIYRYIYIYIHINCIHMHTDCLNDITLFLDNT